MIEKDKTKLDLAESLFRRGKYQEAIILLEKIRKSSTEEESVILLMAWAYYDSGDTRKAEKCLNILLEKELKRRVFTGFAFDELVRIYKQEKNFKKLTKICERAVAAQPDDVGLLNELGNAYLKSGKAKKAGDIYKKLIKMESENPVYYCLLGDALFAAGLSRECEKVYLQASEIDPDQPDHYYFKIAVLFQKAENHKDALRLLNECIAVDSSNPLYYCSLGDSLVGLGQIQDALAAYNKAVQCDNPRAGAYLNRLGHALLKRKNFSQAVEAFQSAISYEPARPYYFSLATAYKGMGLADQADEILCELNKIK
jgi:tetratricopeptide (TPR) repeat protein